MQIPAEQLFEFSPSIMVVLDRASGTVRAANLQARNRLGCEPHECSLLDLADEASAELLTEKIRSLSAAQPMLSGRFTLRSGRPIGFTLRLLPDSHQALLVGRDLSTTVSSYERLANLFQGARMPMLIWEPSGVLHESNASLSEWTGRSTEDLTGSRLDELFDEPLPVPGDTVETWMKTHRGRMAVHVETRAFEADDEDLVVGFITDRTSDEREAALERSLAQAQRLEALGRMAAGIAHEFNNMLMAALPWADLIRRKYAHDETLVKAADHIRRSVHRARDITRQLLDFGQPRTPAPSTVEVATILTQQHKLLESASENRTIEVHAPDRTLRVRVDPAQLAQALLNLGLFARDHSHASSVITIRAAQQDASTISILLEWEGPALSDDQQAALFDPFATAEDARRGGLALSVARRIIEQNGGRIFVESNARHSRLDVCIPAAEPETERIEDVPADLFSGVAILIVDNNVASISGLIPLLQEKGASVHLVTSASDAALAAAAVPVNIAILDAGLAGTTPAEMAAAIFGSRPRSRIIFTSGGTADDLDLPADSRIAFLGKPFELDDLMRRLAALASIASTHD